MLKEFLINPSECKDFDSDAGIIEEMMFSDETVIVSLDAEQTYLDKASETLMIGKVVFVDLMIDHLNQEDLFSFI